MFSVSCWHLWPDKKLSIQARRNRSGNIKYFCSMRYNVIITTIETWAIPWKIIYQLIYSLRNRIWSSLPCNLIFGDFSSIGPYLGSAVFLRLQTLARNSQCAPVQPKLIMIGVFLVEHRELNWSYIVMLAVLTKLSLSNLLHF